MDQCEVCKAETPQPVVVYGHEFCSNTCATLFFDDYSRQEESIYCDSV